MRALVLAVVLVVLLVAGLAAAQDHQGPPSVQRVRIVRRSQVLAARDVRERFARAQADLQALCAEASKDLGGANVVNVAVSPDGESAEWVVQDTPAQAKK